RATPGRRRGHARPADEALNRHVALESTLTHSRRPRRFAARLLMFSFSSNTIHPAGRGSPASERSGASSAVMSAVCMASLDTAIANTASPTIARDSQASDAGSIWVISGYQSAMVAGSSPAAASGEISGHRRVYMVGIVVFKIGRA
ncbi:hypothetical protein OY671_012874, partial [Metschnikowia pulcherrima]